MYPALLVCLQMSSQSFYFHRRLVWQMRDVPVEFACTLILEQWELL